MNPYMTSFAALGLIYVMIGVWSLVMWFMPSLGIAVVGVLVCTLGWKFSERHLQ